MKKFCTDRFFPQMRMGHILAFLEMKPGYGTLVYDFHISENTKSSSPEAEIRLLVAHLDNIETSSCLITPPNVNFILNGKGVQNRNNLSMDTGPQIPTALSSMLNNGVNILQVVGQFNGSYIVVIASMSMTSTPDSAALPDYVQPESASVDPGTNKIFFMVIYTWISMSATPNFLYVFLVFGKLCEVHNYKFIYFD
nr:E4 SUMO-protein ligase PIAL2-like [Ipomoea batatas]